MLGISLHVSEWTILSAFQIMKVQAVKLSSMNHLHMPATLTNFFVYDMRSHYYLMSKIKITTVQSQVIHHSIAKSDKQVGS